jgi:hypothetical protein
VQAEREGGEHEVEEAGERTLAPAVADRHPRAHEGEYGKERRLGRAPAEGEHRDDEQAGDDASRLALRGQRVVGQRLNDADCGEGR